MASVLLLSSASENDSSRPHPYDELNRMRESAKNDKFGVHQCTDDPEEADIILFVENCSTFDHYFNEVRGHPFYQNYPEKCFLHIRHGYAVPFLPGVYASLRRRWYDPSRVRAGSYLRVFAHDFIEYDGGATGREFLYSFQGNVTTHPVRQEIMDLKHDRQYLQDTSSYWPYGDLDPKTQEQLESRYREVSLKSKFILCPRGRGTSSIRLFECLRMGRPPVIISDAWVAPEGPSWEEFSLRIPEAKVDRIPSILEERESRAAAMGEQARQAWEHWFSKQAMFHRVVEWCLDIKKTRSLPESILRFKVLAQLTRPRYFRMLMGTLLPDRYKEKIKAFSPQG